MNFFDTIISLLMSICMLLTGFLDSGTPKSSANVELVKEEKLLFMDAMYSGQGVTTDGEYFYTSGSITAFGLAGIMKWDSKTMECVAQNTDAIPSEYKEYYGHDHIGGISYYNGKIYAAVENKAEDYPLVITYDCETLEMIDIFNVEPAELLPDGIPWCAVDAEKGLLYCSPFHDVESILAFDLETMEFSHEIKLSRMVTRIQGGEVYDGILYLSYDAESSNTDQILTVDLSNGNVEKLCSRTVPSMAGNEAEGVTIYPMEDGSLIHVLDYDKTVGVYLRHYKVIEE